MNDNHPLKTINFLTAGHVDDGKSTLIGRLLYDIGVVPDDHIAAATDAEGTIDYSLFTDGLEDERRQGITIDVAYRYFRHEGCRYRIADTPGHLQYMRNMAVAAVASDVAVVLVDGIHGVRLQTVEYSKIARFFGVRQFIVAINKMDAVDYAQTRYDAIKADYLDAFRDDETPCEVYFVPVSALCGDNIAQLSKATPWYDGKTLLEYLQGAQCHTHSNVSLRLPIQHVIKQGDTRWYLGTLHGEDIAVGDELVTVDSGQHVTVKAITHSGQSVRSAERRHAVAISVEEDVDITRGSVLCRATTPGIATEGFYAQLLWLDSQYDGQDMVEGTIKIHHAETQAQITVEPGESVLKSAFVNLAHPLTVDTYAQNPHTGLFMLIDMYQERVIAVGTVQRVIPVGKQGDYLGSGAL